MLKYILTFLISMVPIVELRGGIPFGVSMGIKWYYAVPICMIGNMLPVPFIFFFARKILEWGADKKFIGKFFSWCLKKGHSGGEKLKAKAGKGMFWALLLFVGIPLPGTGAWTGTLAASQEEHYCSYSRSSPCSHYHDNSLAPWRRSIHSCQRIKILRGI